MEFSDSTEVFFKDNPQRRFDFKPGFALAVAVVFCFLLLIACIVLAFLYSHELGKPLEVSFPEKNSSSEKVHVEKYEICDKDECFYLGQVMVHNMNKSVDPCEDFYAYACGGWQQRHPLKNNATSSTRGTKVWRENIEVLEKALGWAHKNYSKNEAVMKMVRVYESCLNTNRIEILGLKPLNDLIQEYGGWTISQNYDPNVTIAQRMGRAARDLNVDTLLGMDVRPNIHNTSINVLMLKESSLGLDKGDYLNPDANSQKKRKEYKDYMKTVSRIFRVPYAKMEAIYEFEVKLAKIVSGKSLEAALKDHIRKIAEQTRTRRNTDDGTIKLTKLCQETGFPWSVLKEYLDVLFDREFTGDERIQPHSTNKAFLKAISPLYKETDHTLQADYIMWQVVCQYIGALPDRYRSSTPTRMDILGFPGYWWYRWHQCIHAMLKPFDMPLGLLFVEAVNFNNDAKVKIRDMIENVRTSFIQELSSQTWMDKPTQKKAKEKALAMVVEDIGYPSYIKDPAKLKAQYDSLTVTNSLMDNLKAANHFYRMRTLNKFQRPVDKKEWSSGNPIEYNAYYSFTTNKIAFLAGYLREPMYSTEYPRYINYGYTGVTIGHEISHGFDNEGHLYDKNGDFNVWWSASSEANFESKSKCFVKQYNKFKVFDKYVNGTKTLGDNIADNGGIKLAYDAYQRWTKRNGTEKILPGFNLSPNQLFFVAYAQTWCSVYNKEGAYEQLATDDHATGKYRVLGPLSNFKKFSEVFKCPPKSGMNPVNKCELW